jgi:hypothetical protein
MQAIKRSNIRVEKGILDQLSGGDVTFIFYARYGKACVRLKNVKRNEK